MPLALFSFTARQAPTARASPPRSLSISSSAGPLKRLQGSSRSSTVIFRGTRARLEQWIGRFGTSRRIRLACREAMVSNLITTDRHAALRSSGSLAATRNTAPSNRRPFGICSKGAQRGWCCAGKRLLPATGNLRPKGRNGVEKPLCHARRGSITAYCSGERARCCRGCDRQAPR